MSIPSQDTYAALGLPLTVIGGGASYLSTFSTFTVSSMNVNNLTAVNINSLFTSTQTLEANDGFVTTFSSLTADISTLTTDFFSTNIMEAEEAYISSLSTNAIYLDGSLLTTVGSELLLNGIPIATTSNISSLADWSYDPAISTVNMNGNDIINALLISTTSLNAGSVLATNLVCQDISTFTLTAFSTIHAISSISSSVLEVQSATVSSLVAGADSVSSLTVSSINGSPFVPFQIISTFDTASISSLAISTINGIAYPQNISTIDSGSFSSLTVSTINGEPFPQNISTQSSLTVSSINGVAFPQNISTIDNGSISSLTVSSINGTVFPQSLPDVSLWANYPAVSSVVVNNQNILADKGTNVTEQSAVNILAQNGRNGEITLNAKAGYLGASGGVVNVIADGGQTGIGLYGAVNITANPGLTGAIGSGGLVNITAVSATALSNLTSAVKISAGGVNSYAGVIPSFGSVFGYNFIYGSLGVSLCAGLPPSGFQIPGTTYIYGTTGIALNSDVYATRFYPYWDGLTAPADILISGRTTISGSASVKLSNVTNIFMDSGAISGVNTINGSSYPPLIPSTIEGVIGISTNFGTVSSVVEFVAGNQLGITTDLPNNTLTFSIPTNFTASTILTNPLGFVSTGLVIADDMVASSISVSTITDLASINGTAFPPGGPGNIVFNGGGSIDANTGLSYDGVSSIINGVNGNFLTLDDSFGNMFMTATTGSCAIAAGGGSVNVSVDGSIVLDAGTVNPSVLATGNLVPNGVFNLGSASQIWQSVYTPSIIGGNDQSINLDTSQSIILSTSQCAMNIYGIAPLIAVSADFIATASTFNLGAPGIPWNNLSVSTINGEAYFPFSGSLSTIKNGTAFANIDASGLIFIDNSDAVSGTQYINMDYTGVSVVAQGNLLLRGDTTSKILIDGNIDDLAITGGGGQSINLGVAGSIIISTATCGLNIYGATPLVTVSSDFLPTASTFNLGSASIPWNNLNVSTVNGQAATAFAASWANFPAGATIDAGGYSITNVTTITTGAVVQPCIQYGTATTSVPGTVTITLTTEYASATYSAIITPLDSAFPTLVPSVANRTTTSFDIKGDGSTDYQWVTFGSVY